MDQANREYAATNDYFKRCCAAAGIQPTSRQASKFRNKHGKAWEASRELSVKPIDNSLDVAQTAK
jgi:hypothetical protein